MSENIYYLSANTGCGYISFFDDIIASFKKVIVLKNIPNSYKQKIFDEIENEFNNENVMYDKIISCGTSDETDALIITSLSTVIADEGIVTKEIPLYSDVIDFINILNCDCIEKRDLAFLNNKIERIKKKMIAHLAEAKKTHDEWEKIYISNLDFDKINIEADKLISCVFDNVTAVDSVPDDCRRFFGTLLPRGNINYIDKITNGFKKRIFIKGRPGTGKSTILKKFASEARKKGYSTETYYCSLDTNSLDMVVVRKLGIAVFDSTSPHEKFPEYPYDTVFDVYETGKKSNIDDYYADELMIIKNEYNEEIKKAKECLYTIQALKNETSKILKADDVIIEDITSRIVSMISIK